MNRAVNPSYNIALMASAGTGKTYNLALRVVSILMRDFSPEYSLYDIHGEASGKFTGFSTGRILCITFTRKATAEMAQRINRYLTDLALGVLDESSNEYKTVAAVLKIDSSMEMQARAKKALKRIYAEPNTLQIRTIDSFVNMILRLFPFEAGIRPDFETLDEFSAEAIRQEAFERTFNNLDDHERYHAIFNRYIKWFNIRPLDFTENLSVQIQEGVLERAVTLEEQLYRSSKITVDELEKMMGASERSVTSIRYALVALINYIDNCKHAYKVKKAYLNRQEAIKEIAYGNGNIEELLKCCKVLETVLEMPKFKPMPESYAMLYSEFRSAVADYVRLYELLDVTLIMHMASRVQEEIDRQKLEHGLLTFSDITYAAYQMLHRPDYGISNDYLYFRLDGRLEHILVDEFQDTSDVQWRLLQPLADEAMAGSGQSDKIGSFFCVGDPKQTIYRFRGSDPNFFHRIINEYQGRLEQEELRENFRSDRAIVDFVNRLFAPAESFLAGGEGVRFDFTPQSAASENEGYVKLSIVRGEDAEERRIARGERLLSYMDELKQAGWPAGEIAILVRTHKEGMKLRRILENAGWKSHVTFGEKLSAGPSFKIVAALIKYIYLESPLCLAEFMLQEPALAPSSAISDKQPFFYLKKTLDASLERSKGLPVYERLMLLDGALSLSGRLAQEKDFAALIEIIAANLATVVNPLEFLDRLALVAANTPMPLPKLHDSVTIMTIHGSKGLQFPVVIMHEVKKAFSVNNNQKYFVDTGDDGVPILRKRLLKPYADNAPEEYAQALEREAVLTRQGVLNELYVASTRAEHVLYVTVESQSSNNVDKYIEGIFPEGYTQGILPSPETSTVYQASSKAEKIFDFCNYVIGEPLSYIDDAQRARDVMIEALKDGGQPAELRNRALDYLDEILAQKEDKAYDKGVEPYSSRYYGIFVHEVLYQIEEFTSAGVDMAVDKAYNRYGGYLEAWTKNAARESVLKLVADKRWQELISDAEIHREKATSGRQGLSVIDFYAIKPDRIIVVDFKTGSGDSKRHDEYVVQVGRYKAILQRQYRKNVDACLVFLDPACVNIEMI